MDLGSAAKDEVSRRKRVLKSNSWSFYLLQGIILAALRHPSKYACIIDCFLNHFV